ncbi:MAG TPA: hypothetical protein VJO16_00340 [Candidatus Acidoferrum sp.]|nr:hypothetical protein [Candidatus Acidoferrum sp.]
MNRTVCLRKTLLVTCTLAILPSMVAAQEHAAEEKVPAASTPVVSAALVENDALLRAVFPGRKNWGRVEKGTTLEGRLSLPLYAGEEMVAPADSVVRVTVNSAEKIREPLGFWRKSGRAIVRAFNPLETSHPAEYHVELSSADLLIPTGEVRPLNVRVLRANSGVMVQPKSGSLKSARAVREKSKAGNILLMSFSREALSSATSGHGLVPVSTAGEQRSARAYMLTGLRSSTNHQGDTFRAQLAEPVRIGGRMFAPGSMVEGTVARRAPPRMLSRAGKLSLRVDRVVPAEGEPVRVGGSLSAAEAESQTRFALDEEGTLRGRKPGVVNALVDVGYAYFVGKVSDDIAETPIRAIGGVMSDAAVANAARYVGLGSSLVFLVTRHGRDVYLPKYSLIEINFGRVNEDAAAGSHD